MFLLLWKTISICEKSSLKVIAVTCNGAFPNRKLFRMHCHLTQDDDMKPETGVTYDTRNLFSGTQNRFLYFISDVPHLFKAARNCLSNSESGKFTSYVWNGGVFLLWNHVTSQRSRMWTSYTSKIMHKTYETNTIFHKEY